MADQPTTTVRIETDDGATDELTIPTALVERLAEGEDSSARTLADVLMLSVANHAHHWRHHGGEEAGEALVAAEEAVMTTFEERFGMTFGEATGHQH